MVYTATRVDDVDEVEFLIDGEPVTVFSSEGIELDGPQERSDYYDQMLPPIFVDEPAWGEPVTSPVEVEGLSNVFEAVSQVMLTDDDGLTLDEETVMADQTKEKAFGHTRSRVGLVDVGGGQITVEAIVGKVNATRSGRDLQSNIKGTSLGRLVINGEEAEFPNPFFGVNSVKNRDRWAAMPAAGKCALRWRSAVRLSAHLRRELPRDQLLTLRYEEMVASPYTAAERLSAFLETRVSAVSLLGGGYSRVGAWRRRLRPDDRRLVEKVAREELTRLGYLPG